MFSLLVVSLVLSVPAAVSQTAMVPSDPTVTTPPLVLLQPESPINDDGQVRPFDAMEIHLDSDICYKIRSFIFSPGANPRLLRETTCGPKQPTAKSIDGAKPKFVPLSTGGTSVPAPKR